MPKRSLSAPNHPGLRIKQIGDQSVNADALALGGLLQIPNGAFIYPANTDISHDAISYNQYDVIMISTSLNHENFPYEDVRKLFDEQVVALPAGYRPEFGGQFENLERARTG